MDATILSKWITNTSEMDKYSYNKLKQLIEQYPYFEVAHLLLLKGLNNNNSIRLTEELKNTTLHVTNRKQLFLFLNNNIDIKTISPTAPLKIVKQTTNPISDISATSELTDTYDIPMAGNFYTLTETETTEEKQKEPSNLIDNFIKKEPRIERNIEISDAQEDVSQSSLQENNSFMSETLASIYLKQKLFNKAILVYRKLELINPQKSVYFANRIKEIEKLKNNN